MGTKPRREQEKAEQKKMAVQEKKVEKTGTLWEKER